MNIDILKTVAVQATEDFCSENNIEQTFINLSDFYKAQAKPIAFDLIATGLNTTEAWGIAYNRVKNR